MVLIQIGGSSDSPSPWTTVTKDSDEIVNNSTTVQADDELKFDGDANSVYFIDCYLYVKATSVSDIRLGFHAPTSSDGGIEATWGAINNSISGNSSYPMNTSDFQAVRFHAIIVTMGTAGEIGLDWAQSNTEVFDTTIKAGSFITYRKMA